MIRPTLTILTLAAFLGLAACGGDATAGGDAGTASSSAAASSPSSGSELSAVEMEQGIGPVRDLELAALDPAMAEEGEESFRTKCSACHKMGERFVGPDLADVLDRRRPEFVMNMILNANEMVQRHPVVREMLAQYYTPMTVQVTDPEEARAILEYLRSVAATDTTTQ